MKYLLVLAVVAVGLWLLLRQRGPARPPSRPPEATGGRAQRGPVAMVACAHCDLRLPVNEAWVDDLGRPYCSEAHRAAGPRT